MQRILNADKISGCIATMYNMYELQILYTMSIFYIVKNYDKVKQLC